MIKERREKLTAKKELRKEILARIKREVDTTEWQTGKFGVRDPKANESQKLINTTISVNTNL